MTKDEALKLALEALKSTLSDNQPYIVKCGKAITAIKEALTIEIAADSQAFHGFPDGPVSALNASGKCVTAGETAP